MPNVHTSPQGGKRIVHAELIGTNTCIAAGMTVRGHAPALAMCRELLAADPDTALEVFRNGVLSLRIKSIAAGAKLDVKDDSRGTPRFNPHRPPPDKPDGIVSPEARLCGGTAGEGLGTGAPSDASVAPATTLSVEGAA